MSSCKQEVGGRKACEASWGGGESLSHSRQPVHWLSGREEGPCVIQARLCPNGLAVRGLHTLEGDSHTSPGQGGRAQSRLAGGARHVTLGTRRRQHQLWHLQLLPCRPPALQHPRQVSPCAGGENRPPRGGRGPPPSVARASLLPAPEAARPPGLPNTPEASWKKSGKTYKNGSRPGPRNS